MRRTGVDLSFIAEMTVTETFDLVKFEWTGDRSVKVRIRHSVLTLST